MKHIIYTLIVLLFASTISGFAQTSPEKNESSSKITLPWQEFKDMLHMDDQEMVIGLETFQKLLEQTGSKTKPAYTIKNGNVILTRQAFDDLVRQMKPPQNPDDNPPFEYLITKAIYQGKMQKQSTRFKATLTIHVLKNEGYVRVPILPQSLALENVSVNQKQALVVSQGGMHTILLKESGQYHVEAIFSIQSDLEKGPHRIDLQIQNTPITLLELEIPLVKIDVEIPQAQQLSTVTQGNQTKILGVISSGNNISIRWRKQIAMTEKAPPKLYAEVHHLISIEDDALKTNSEVLLNILHSEIENVRFAIPDDLNILSVSGEGVGEWQETSQQQKRILNVPFTYSKKGNMSIYIVSEKPFHDGEMTTSFEGLQLLDVVRETGFIGIELNTSAEVNVLESDQVEKIPIQKLPQRLMNKSNKPLILGFKYLKHPYQITLSIEKHEKIVVPVATVQSANAVTLFTEDGKVVHRLVYEIRNSAKQFLELRIPKDADVWSVFVGNEPVESSMNSQGRLLIPLIRSQSVGNQLNTFPVEIILCVVQEPFHLTRTMEVNLPKVDLFISQLIWSVYLPNDYEYLHFTSTLEKEEIIRGVNLFNKAKRSFNEGARQRMPQIKELDSDAMPSEELNQVYEGKDYSSKFRNVPMDKMQMKSQVENELNFSDRLDELSRQEAAPAASGAMSTGVLPVQIKIPTSGQVYRFAKTIIKGDDPLQIKVFYCRQWMIQSIRWLLTVVMLLVIYLLRMPVGKLFAFIRSKWLHVQSFYRKQKKSLLNMWTSRLFPFVLLGLAFLCWQISGFLTALVFFVLFLVIIDRIYKFMDRKKGKKK